MLKPVHKSFFKNGSILILLSLVLLLVEFQALRIFYSHADDWEHLAAAWFVFQGYQPYSDFFQHHHPLLWYILSPVFYAVKNPVDSFFLGRILAGFFFFGSFGFIWGIIRRLNGNFWIFLIAIFVYLAYPLGNLRYIYIRPDVPMIFFLLGGFYFWICFYQSRFLKDIIFSYAFFFLAFAFLQKAVLILAPFSGYQLYLLLKKDIRWRDVLRALIVPVLCVVGYGIYLAFTGTFIRYFEVNWLLNLFVYHNYRTYPYVIYDYVFGAITLFGVIFGFLRSSGLKRHLIFVFFVFSVLFLMIPKPYHYYWDIWIPFSSLIIGFALGGLKYKPLVLEVLAPCFLLTGLVFWQDGFGIMPEVLEIRSLSRHVKPTDKIITYGQPEYAFLSPRPEHYYYFSLTRVSLTDSRVFKRHSIPQWTQIAAQEKPKFLCSYTVYDLTKAGDDDRTNFLMGVDIPFVKEHYRDMGYTYLPVWQRKDSR